MFSESNKLFTATGVTLLAALVVVGSFWLAVPVEAQPPAVAAEPAEGYFKVKGQETVKDEKYGGVAQVQKVGDGWVVRWYLGDASTTGVGLLDKGKFTVGWSRNDGFNVRGVTTYEVKDKGKTLEGVWVSLPGDGKPRNERLVWVVPLEPEDRDEVPKGNEGGKP